MESPNLANVKIIDADGHVRDRDADIRKFMAEPYCRRVGFAAAERCLGFQHVWQARLEYYRRADPT